MLGYTLDLQLPLKENGVYDSFFMFRASLTFIRISGDFRGVPFETKIKSCDLINVNV